MNLKNSQEEKNFVASSEIAEEAQELSEEELDDISGGKVSMQEMHVTKGVDKSSPNLFGACATGKHFPKASL